MTPSPSSDSVFSSRLTAREKISYGFGAIAFALAYSGISSLALPIFNIELGVSATLVGVALAIGRLWDAFSDPLMGTISDNARTRWGRRRPFILLGGLLCGVTFPLFWFVPSGWSEWGIFAWLTACILLYYTATTIYSVPWLSLGYELNPDPIERVRLQVWAAYFIIPAGLALEWIYRGAQSDLFGDTMTGMRWIGAACGLVFVLAAIPNFLGCRERIDRTVLNQKPVPMLVGLKTTLSNRGFLILILGMMTPMLAVGVLVGSLGVYINSYYIFPGDTKTGAAYAAAFGTLFLVVKVIFMPFVLRLVARYGKMRVIRVGLVLTMLASLGKFFLFTPQAPWLQFIVALLLAPASVCISLIVNPLKADCADYDEWKTGNRRSGSYASVANFLEKLTSTILLVFAGVLVDWSGFDPALGANQPADTTLIWRLAFAGVPMVAYAIFWISLHYYPYTDERMAEIRADLKSRNEG
jgi:GPH family glycoside/pentoside/hexuronide:cation symporter